MGVIHEPENESPKAVQPRILSTADWHLGHRRVPTADTINDIRKWLFPKLSECDILCIIGDIFDGEVSLNSHDANLIIDLLADILIRCFECNIIVRVVRGTFTHDNLQNNIFTRLYGKLGVPVDYALMDNLSVEHIDRFNIDIMYMPDNLPYRNKNDVLDAAKTLLVANNMKYVHYVLIHGEFDHMVFGHVNANAYNSKDFVDICNGLLLAGHIHKPHRHKNIIYTGSFNRLAHNEEEAKGFWMIRGMKSTFFENMDATKFITVDYRDETNFEVLLAKHIEIVKQFGTERLGFLRLVIVDTNLKQAIAGYHNTNHPNIKLTFKHAIKSDHASKYLSEKLKKKQIEVLEVPSLKNISAIVCKHLSAKGIHMSLKIAESIINGG